MELIIIIIFIIGYLMVALEHQLKLNKSASALLTATLCWAIYALGSDNIHTASHALEEHVSEVSGILFFLLGAMTIVELIDAHDGFEIITGRIQTTSKRKLVWIICLITFFLSAVLDNLTTSIVMVSLISKMVDEKKVRLMLAGMIVISANAGGAWSPIGDVTTTMLWIGGHITTGSIIANTFLPSLVCLIVPAIIVSMKIKGTYERPEKIGKNINYTSSEKERNLVFWIGLTCLLFVPVFKTITDLPPFMGILFGLGVMWVLTELIHSGRDEEEKGVFSVNHALRKIDTPSILFFMGILLSIGVLQSVGTLGHVAGWLTEKIGNMSLITLCIGALSAVVDNVPLVAAVQGMYSLDQYPPDHFFWQFLAYCAGTGGSMLIIGSAAGIAAMGIEKMEFIWYLKKISLLALAGYLAGAVVFLLQQSLQ